VYRKSATPPQQPAGDLVTARSYPDTVMAEADRAHLASEGIVGYVIEAASFNPALASAIGGVRLQVSERDLERATEILGVISPEESEGDDEGDGAVRCPRCELAYCAHERPRMHNAAPGLGFLLLPYTMIFSEKRWHCHKCGHAWDDPKAGPTRVTRLVPGDPRPVFRLRRAHGGMGLFLGAIAGAVAALLIKSELGVLLFFALIALGVSIGRALRYDVCSVPECRAPLPPEAEACPKCKGGIAGVVHTAEEHYAAAADFRRELAGIRADARAKKRKKKAARAAS
jgi:rubredoxin